LLAKLAAGLAAALVTVVAAAAVVAVAAVVTVAVVAVGYNNVVYHARVLSVVTWVASKISLVFILSNFLFPEVEPKFEQQNGNEKLVRFEYSMPKSNRAAVEGSNFFAPCRSGAGNDNRSIQGERSCTFEMRSAARCAVEKHQWKAASFVVFTIWLWF
jgi:hypothetical protein